MSLSGDETILGGTVDIGVQASPVSPPRPNISRPRSKERLITRASIGIAHELNRIFRAKLTRDELISRLILVAECAYADFRSDIVESIGDLLVEAANTREAAIGGRFYQALGLNRGGLGDWSLTEPMFEAIADDSPPHYRARSLVVLANLRILANDPEGSLSRYRDALRVVARERSLDIVTFFVARKQAAVVRSIVGDHRGSLDDLENLLPLARAAGSIQPFLYYDYLNALAVELAEAGKLEHAHNASSIVIASPFESIFPAFRETFDEIAAKQKNPRRSAAARSGATAPGRPKVRSPERPRAPRFATQRTNLLVMRAAERETGSEEKESLQTNEIARVIDFQEWKAQTKTPAHFLSGALTSDQRAAMTTGEKLIRLMDLISRDDTDDEMIDKILDTVEAIVLNGHRQELD